MNNHSPFILNPNFDYRELTDALNERLNKANALAQFALVGGVSDHVNQAVHNYLWALSQLIEEACEISHKMVTDNKVGVSR